MPLVGVTFAPTNDVLERLGVVVSDIVAEEADCPEEPWTGPAGPGDIEIRFRPRHELDVGDSAVVIEIRTKLFESRAQDRQARANVARDRLRPAVGALDVGAGSSSTEAPGPRAAEQVAPPELRGADGPDEKDSPNTRPGPPG